MSRPFQPRPVYLADSFMLPIGKYNGKHRPKRSFLELVDALTPLIESAQIKKEQIGCVVVGSQNPFAFSGIDNVAAKVCGRLGISGAKSLLVDTASSSGASAFEAAYLEIASGQHDHVLAIGIQKMSDVSTSQATKIVAGVIDREEAEYGLTMPACGALVAQSLMTEFGLNEKEWTEYSARWTERAQAFAAQNPNAHFDYEIPVEQYFTDIEKGKNYLYYDPLRYYDFCPMSDGIAACLLTSKVNQVRVAGVASGTALVSFLGLEITKAFLDTEEAARYLFNSYLPTFVDKSYVAILRSNAEGMSDALWPETLWIWNVGVPIATIFVLLLLAGFAFRRKAILT